MRGGSVADDMIGRLNSATKYPSIMTYHSIDPANGKLAEGTALPFGEGPVLLTEKVDGTNGRIVIVPGGDWFIGSREELLYAMGDRIENPNLGIVPALLSVARGLTTQYNVVMAFFLEVYGKGVGPAAGQYSGKGASGVTGCRLFDVAMIPLGVLGKEREQISSWREHGGQEFLTEGDLVRLSGEEGIALTPRLGTVNADDLPETLEGMRGFLDAHLPVSRAALDETAGRRPEGIVLRTPTRSLIAKARFQDYERTLNPQPRGKKRD